MQTNVVEMVYINKVFMVLLLLHSHIESKGFEDCSIRPVRLTSQEKIILQLSAAFVMY